MALTLAVACLLVAIAPQCIMGCTPTKELTLSEKIERVSVLLLGEVIKHYDNPRLIGKSYTAEMQIFCILKAPTNFPIHAIHNVTEAGVVDARCYSVNLEVDKKYIVLGYVFDGEIRPFDDAIEGTLDNIQEMSRLCGMAPRLPIGNTDGGDSMFCPTHVDNDGCIINSPDSNNANSRDDDHEHDGNDHDHDEDGMHTHDDHHVDHDHADDDHDHDDHHDGHTHDDHDHYDHDDHDDHGHDDHEHDDHDDIHHSDDHSHHHDDHLHDNNDHDHDNDGKHTHEDHHDGHDHVVDDHDHEDHHDEHDNHSHDNDHDHEQLTSVHGSATVVRQTLSIIAVSTVLYFL